MRSGGSLDANVLLRLIVGDIEEQRKKSEKLINDYDSFHISNTALIEVIFALERYYAVPRSEILQVVSSLQGNPKLKFNRPLFEYGLSIYVSCPKLSIEDCCLAAESRITENTPLWTFDSKLANQTKEARKII